MVEVGERIVVHGIHYAIARVSKVTWLPNEHRWMIVLDWADHGTSHVYDSDENRVWYRYVKSN